MIGRGFWETSGPYSTKIDKNPHPPPQPYSLMIHSSADFWAWPVDFILFKVVKSLCILQRAQLISSLSRWTRASGCRGSASVSRRARRTRLSFSAVEMLESLGCSTTTKDGILRRETMKTLLYFLHTRKPWEYRRQTAEKNVKFELKNSRALAISLESS